MKRFATIMAMGTVAPFDPSSITGLNLWLKADALVLNDNDPVGTWTDSSGNGNDFTQGTAGMKPTYKTAILNGEPVVRFDGGDGLIATASIIPTNTTNYTILAVANSASTSAGAHNIFYMGTVGIGYSVQFRRDTAQWSHYHWDGSVDQLAGEAAGVTATAWELVTADWDSTNIHLWRDGVQKQETPVTLMARASTGNSVGFDSIDGDIQYWDGDIAEILIYNSALSSTDRGNVETYLTNKYAL